MMLFSGREVASVPLDSKKFLAAVRMDPGVALSTRMTIAQTPSPPMTGGTI